MAAAIQFSDFGSCGASANGKVQVNIQDVPTDGSQSGNASVGYQGSGSPAVLNITANATQGLIAHEFGHLLGFPHEMTRPDFDDDSTGSCQESDIMGGDTLGTPEDDRSSIMAGWPYCGGFPADLGVWDIVGVQNAYGRKPAGSLVGVENHCVDIPGAANTAGTQLQIYDCHGGSNQKWRRDTSSHLFAPGFSNGFWDIPSSNSANGTVVQIFSQNSPTTANQQFAFVGAEVRAIGNTCIDVPGGNFANNQLVQIYQCNGGGNQKWTIEADGRITNNGFCLDVPSGSTANGTLIQLFQCNGGANQQFTQTAKGELTFGGKCIDVVGGTPASGSLLQLNTCKSDSDASRQNQRFYVRGTLQTLGTCVDIPGGNASNNVAVQLFTCNGGSNQLFDYYFNP
jgi:hypothetical protein